MNMVTGMGFGIVWLVIGIIILALVSVASSVLLGFCVYYDAMHRRVENAVLWGVLSGFFQICALIYLIIQLVKKPQPMRCIQCGEFLMPESRFCTRCGRQLFVPTPEQAQMYDKRRRLFLWLWIGSLVFVFVMSIIITVIFTTSILIANSNAIW